MLGVLVSVSAVWEVGIILLGIWGRANKDARLDPSSRASLE